MLGCPDDGCRGHPPPSPPSAAAEVPEQLRGGGRGVAGHCGVHFPHGGPARLRWLWGLVGGMLHCGRGLARKKGEGRHGFQESVSVNLEALLSSCLMLGGKLPPSPPPHEYTIMCTSQLENTCSPAPSPNLQAEPWKQCSGCPTNVCGRDYWDYWDSWDSWETALGVPRRLRPLLR